MSSSKSYFFLNGKCQTYLLLRRRHQCQHKLSCYLLGVVLGKGVNETCMPEGGLRKAQVKKSCPI